MSDNDCGGGKRVCAPPKLERTVFTKLLIANRSEIACRIIASARRLGMRTVAVYSEADATALHVRLADEAFPLGPAPARQSYLNASRLLEVAHASGAQAVHPGYGFLSENAEFAAACAAAGIAFVGPSASAIEAMGDKAAAKERMRRAGIPVLPGYQGEEQSLVHLQREALAVGFPLIVKPSGGGGGKGMQIVREAQALGAALEAARRIAAAAFGDERLLIERYLPSARHVEAQVLADRHGQVVHLFDRDCSVQRRHQKLIEEAPAPQVPAPVRAQLVEAACAVAREIGYEGAGTVEFLLEGDAFYFMEMNTRLQVEHPVTEAITGLDLVEWQLRIAAGESLGFTQRELRAQGHAIEVRVCAEDPAEDFRPGAGQLQLAQWPSGAGIRVDTGFETGDTVPSHYDSLIAKVIAHGNTRAEVLGRLQAALASTRVAGVPTNIAWLAGALASRELRAGAVDTRFLAQHAPRALSDAERTQLAALAAAAHAYAAAAHSVSAGDTPWSAQDGFRVGAPARIAVRLRAQAELWQGTVQLEAAGRVSVHALSGARWEYLIEPQGASPVVPRVAPEVVPQVALQGALIGAAPPGQLIGVRPAQGGARGWVFLQGPRLHVWHQGLELAAVSEWTEAAVASVRRASGGLSTPLPGTVVSVQVKPGDHVSAGQVLLVVEAMKMEHALRAPEDGIVKAVKVRVGDRVDESSSLLELEGA